MVGGPRDAVGGNLSAARFNGEERLLAGAVSDQESTGGGSGATELEDKTHGHD